VKRVNKVAHIALIFRRGYAHLERLTEGIITYAEEKDLRWSYISIPDHLDASISQLKGWHGDGAIAQLDTPEDAMAALSVGFPADRSVLGFTCVKNSKVKVTALIF
jgi:hypothetical protein